MTAAGWIGASLLLFCVINAYCFYRMIIGAIKSAQYYHEEALWTWNKEKSEIVIFYAHETMTRIPKVINIIQAKDIMKDKGFRYVGSEKYLQTN